ncbi:MAG TPA: hypothetical protein VFQ06_08240 [Nitrospira sp.]|nr:hypothetical protein [Nitrospira sp.]
MGESWPAGSDRLTLADTAACVVAVDSEPPASRLAYLLVGPVRNRWQRSIAPMDILRYSVTLMAGRNTNRANAAASGSPTPSFQDGLGNNTS